MEQSSGHRDQGTSRVSALEGLRGIAVALVFVVHLQVYTPSLWPGGSAFGAGEAGARVLGMLWIGVDLFFVLSGFLITSVILRSADWAPLPFLKNRLTRILPAYYVSMVVAIAALNLGMLATFRGWTDIGLHVLLIHNMQQWSMFSINGPYWSLGVEFTFYLFMMATAPLWRARHGWLMIPLMCAIAWIWRSGVWQGVPLEQRFFMASQLPGSLDEFALGAWVAMACRRYRFKEITPFNAAFGFTTLVLGTAIVVYSVHIFAGVQSRFWDTQWLVLFGKTMLCIGFALILLGSICHARRATTQSLVKYSALGWIGMLSYSIYLYHSVVIVLTHRLLGTHLGPGWVFNAITVALTLTISWASYHWIERKWHPSLPA